MLYWFLADLFHFHSLCRLGFLYCLPLLIASYCFNFSSHHLFFGSFCIIHGSLFFNLKVGIVTSIPLHLFILSQMVRSIMDCGANEWHSKRIAVSKIAEMFRRGNSDLGIISQWEMALDNTALGNC